jgi:serine/threonine-protein kinase HipA
VGTLEQAEDGLLRFHYGEGWLQSPARVPLSRSLPLNPGVFTPVQTRPFFAGVLPDQGPRQRIAEALGISADSDFALLEKIGGECAGAVSLLGENAADAAAPASACRPLDERELRQILAELPERPLLAGTRGLRLSLAGAQDKLPVLVRDNCICLPLGDTPSTHILKPEPERFAGLAANELFCLRLASAVGLRVPRAEYRTAAQAPYLLVERYDRTAGPDGVAVRVHQEDFCQALGMAPEMKYEEEGGPRLADAVALLRSWSTRPAVDVPAFVDAVVFNAIVGNADAHGKNFSLLYPGNARHLAPMYDIVCTLAWPRLSKSFAMHIGGCGTLDGLAGKHWQAMAEECGLGWPMLRSRVARLCDSVRGRVAQIAHEASASGAPVPQALLRIIPARAEAIAGSIAG